MASQLLFRQHSTIYLCSKLNILIFLNQTNLNYVSWANCDYLKSRNMINQILGSRRPLSVGDQKLNIIEGWQGHAHDGAICWWYQIKLEMWICLADGNHHVIIGTSNNTDMTWSKSHHHWFMNQKSELLAPWRLITKHVTYWQYGYGIVMQAGICQLDSASPIHLSPSHTIDTKWTLNQNMTGYFNFFPK